jgi:hypothetical protein
MERVYLFFEGRAYFIFPKINAHKVMMSLKNMNVKKLSIKGKVEFNTI